MHRDFCTLFDRNYLIKGVALHESLLQHVEDFTLWILCMDDIAYDTLEKMALPRVALISLAQFEDEDLLRVKATRTQVEYCWTCTPSLVLYVLDHVPAVESVTYLDADLYFFSDPDGAFAEMAAGSIGIVEHRCSREYAGLTQNSGIYNVAFMIFKNDRQGRECLQWWRARCNEWCHDRVEEGKYGDQKYLDDWPERFARVIVLQDVGVGLAPWNLRSHRITTRVGRLLVDRRPLVFYHFHSFSIMSGGSQFRLADSAYGVGRRNAGLIYRPYIAAVTQAMAQVRRIVPDYAHGVSVERPDSRSMRLRASAMRSDRRLRIYLQHLVRVVPILGKARIKSKRLLRRARAYAGFD